MTERRRTETAVQDLQDAELKAALERLSAHDEVLVALDFDGCVAELVADADTARPVPANAEAIERLSETPGIHLAYVSGRPLEALRRLASPPEGTLLIGSHGAERYLGPDSPGLELNRQEQISRTSIIEALESVAAGTDGARVEHKPAGAAIHVRSVQDPAAGEKLLEEARASLAVIDGAHAKEGKKIVEAVVVLSTKGEAITDLRRHVKPGAVFFAGDDVTDEHGFAVLEGDDVGVKVGEGETAAVHRIGGPSDLAGVLHALAELRS